MMPFVRRAIFVHDTHHSPLTCAQTQHAHIHMRTAYGAVPCPALALTPRKHDGRLNDPDSGSFQEAQHSPYSP